MHPYKSAPTAAFWSRAVSENFSERDLCKNNEPLIRVGEPVVSAGSCFASNLVPYLEASGLTYLRVEERHPAFEPLGAESLGYDKFSAAYGNVYTARQLLQLLRRSKGQFHPTEDRWHTSAGVIDPFRPGLRFHASSDTEFDLLNAQHLVAVRKTFEQAAVFIFTLGLTEAWVSSEDGAVFPACPGTVAGEFDSRRHRFVNFSVADVTADLESFAQELRVLNPLVRIILTVSPVPLVATAGDMHVLCASTYSKSVLRVAAQELAERHSFVTYFPSFEIVAGPQAPDRYFEADRRSVSSEAVEVVMRTFLAHCQADPIAPTVVMSGNRAMVAALPIRASSPIVRLSNIIADAECEEVMMDGSARAKLLATQAPDPTASAPVAGGENLAIGDRALGTVTTGRFNVALGSGALKSNTEGSWNVAIGRNALLVNRRGDQNFAIGAGALRAMSGSRNIALGTLAGSEAKTGDNNIYIGHSGQADECGAIRIGRQGAQSAVFVAGVSETGLVGVPVVVSPEGQLGVSRTSLDTVRDPRDVDVEAGRLASLRPVAYRVGEESGPVHYGFVAEDVAETFPELVVRGRDGTALAVRLLELIPLLLKHGQQQQARVDRLERALQEMGQQQSN